MPQNVQKFSDTKISSYNYGTYMDKTTHHQTDRYCIYLIRVSWRDCESVCARGEGGPGVT